MFSIRRFVSPLAVSLALLVASNAYAQATRTWVSGVGDDANPCSRTAPCKTFAGAISKTAAAGEIDVLDPGGFGGVTITKAISIESDGVIAGILVSGTPGITISAGPTDVIVLRGLTFDGILSGTDGIQINTAGTVIVDNCYIKGFVTRGISVQPTASTNVFISNTNIQASASNGLVVAPAGGGSAQVSLDNVNIVNNTNFGLSITGGSTVVVRNSTISGNAVGTAFANIRVAGAPGTATLVLDNVVVNNSPDGIDAISGATVTVNNSTISNNTTGLSTTGASILTFGNNRLIGNTTPGSFTGPASPGLQ
jgi:hypothetical protein